MKLTGWGVIVLSMLALMGGCNYGATPAPTPADTAAAPAVQLPPEDEALLQRIDTPAQTYQPVTKANYQQELTDMEKELAADQ